MQSTTQASQVECPECEATIKVEAGTMTGEVIPCPDCGIELEVSSVQPLKLEPAPEVEEDWGE